MTHHTQSFGLGASCEFSKMAAEVEPIFQELEKSHPGIRLKLADELLTKHADLSQVMSGLGDSLGNGFGQAGDWLSKNLNISPELARTGLGAGGGLLGALLLSNLLDMDMPQALLLSLVLGGGGGYLGKMFGEGKGLGKGQWGNVDPEKAYGALPQPDPVDSVNGEGQLNAGSPTWNNPPSQPASLFGYNLNQPVGNEALPNPLSAPLLSAAPPIGGFGSVSELADAAAASKASPVVPPSRPPQLLTNGVPKLTQGQNQSASISQNRPVQQSRPALQQTQQSPPLAGNPADLAAAAGNTAKPYPSLLPSSGMRTGQVGNDFGAMRTSTQKQQKPIQMGKPNSLGIIQPNIR